MVLPMASATTCLSCQRLPDYQAGAHYVAFRALAMRLSEVPSPKAYVDLECCIESALALQSREDDGAAVNRNKRMCNSE